MPRTIEEYKFFKTLTAINLFWWINDILLRFKYSRNVKLHRHFGRCNFVTRKRLENPVYAFSECKIRTGSWYRHDMKDCAARFMPQVFTQRRLLYILGVVKKSARYICNTRVMSCKLRTWQRARSDRFPAQRLTTTG